MAGLAVTQPRPSQRSPAHRAGHPHQGALGRTEAALQCQYPHHGPPATLKAGGTAWKTSHGWSWVPDLREKRPALGRDVLAWYSLPATGSQQNAKLRSLACQQRLEGSGCRENGGSLSPCTEAKQVVVEGRKKNKPSSAADLCPCLLLDFRLLQVATWTDKVLRLQSHTRHFPLSRERPLSEAPTPIHHYRVAQILSFLLPAGAECSG